MGRGWSQFLDGRCEKGLSLIFETYSLEEICGFVIGYLTGVESLMKGCHFWLWFDFNVFCEEGARWFVMNRKVGWSFWCNSGLRLGDVGSGIVIVDAVETNGKRVGNM